MHIFPFFDVTDVQVKEVKFPVTVTEDCAEFYTTTLFINSTDVGVALKLFSEGRLALEKDERTDNYISFNESKQPRHYNNYPLA